MQSTAYRVSADRVCHVCAMPLLDTARDSQSVLELHADASAQCSTALQTVGGYAGNT